MILRDEKGRFVKGTGKPRNWYHLSGDNHPTKVKIEPELLFSLYWGNRYLQREIADLLNCSTPTIIKLMQDYNIPVREWKKGKNNPKWKGGISKFNRTERELSKAKESIWRKQIYKRDNYTCQLCHKVGGILNAHHIKSWAKYPKERLVIDNGITLCVDCHRWVHSKSCNSQQ